MSRSFEVLRTRVPVELGGVLVALAVGAVLFTRFSINGTLSRDEGIYAYAGEQLSHGVAPYASIFDPKGPLGTMIAGLGAGLGRALGHDPLVAIRYTYLCFAVLTVGAIYLLALQLWNSVAGALAAVAVFSAFKGFAEDALPGPDAKTPGILFAVLAMWLAVRRQWLWSAVLGSLATLVWQPLGFFPLMALLGALAWSPGRRWRAFGITLAGAVAPVVATVIYFAAAGATGKLIESTVLYPLTGVQQGHETVWQRIQHIAWVVHHGYGVSGAWLFWTGLALLVLIVIGSAAWARAGWWESLRAPLVLVVLFTLLGEAAFASSNFQGNPDLFPLLPYAALGIGGTVALATRASARAAALRVATPAIALGAALALVVWAAQWYTNAPENDRGLRGERVTGCALDEIVVPGTPLYSLGSPVPLIMTGRRNPDRFVYLASGVDSWKVHHTTGGFHAWMAQVRDSNASVVVILGWRTPLAHRAAHWLKTVGHYRPGYLGQWRVFVTPAALAQAGAAGIKLTPHPSRLPFTAAGPRFKRQHCGIDI